MIMIITKLMSKLNAGTIFENRLILPSISKSNKNFHIKSY